MARVLIHFDDDGNVSWLAEAGIVLVMVDERAPRDRVYISRGKDKPEALDMVIAGADPTGASRPANDSA